MKKLLLICTKEMHFSFNGKMYQQIDGVAMGSPLGPVIANIFMSELEKTLDPALSEDVSFWTRYVDDTFAFVREGSVQKVLDCLNGFHPSIQFTHENEVNGKIAFLDVNVSTRNDRRFDTSIHRKSTDTISTGMPTHPKHGRSGPSGAWLEGLLPYAPTSTRATRKSHF